MKKTIQIGYWPAPEVMMTIAFQDALWSAAKFADGAPSDEIKMPRRALWNWMASFQCWLMKQVNSCPNCGCRFSQDCICTGCGGVNEANPGERSFKDGVRTMRTLIREEIDKKDASMKHEHNPDVRANAQWEYCWRCRIERVLTSEIDDYHVLR